MSLLAPAPAPLPSDPREPAAGPASTGPRARPRYRPLQGFGAAFTWGVRLLLGRRRRLIAICLLGALLGILVGTEGIPRFGANAEGLAAYALWQTFDESLLPYLIPLVALTLVAGGFQREVADRTLLYHLVRPISRRTLFLARFLAGVVVAVPVAILPLAFTLAFAGVDLPFSVWASLPVTAALGVLSAGAVYYLLAAWFRYGIIAGLIYTFAIDEVVRNATGSMQKLSALFYVRSVHHRLTDEAFAALSSAVREEVQNDQALSRKMREALDKIQSGQLGPGVIPDAERIAWMDPGTAALVLLAVTVGLLVLGLWIVSRKDYALKE